MNNNVIEILTSDASQVLPEGALAEKLKTGKKLKVKLGMDPTAPDLHLGHAVVLSKMKQFQDLGHEIILIIGDYTARIGDPTGKSKTRPPLTEKEIKKNIQTYFEQVGKILDTDNFTIRYNSEWLDKLTSKDLVKLCALVTLARLTERDDFANRIKNNQPVRFHELLYPIFQGYDSVVLNADVELGGTDQTFNLLMGRFLQEQSGQEPQVVLTMPLLEGLDGHEKMSKSLGNAIGLAEPADQAFGKLMSMSDDVMWRYFELLLNKNHQEISGLQERIASGNLHPMALKKEMAYEVIKKFWSQQEAEEARDVFEKLFQKKDYSQVAPVVLPEELENPIWIVKLLKTLDAVKTTSEAKRLIEAGAISIDDKKITDFEKKIKHKKAMVVKVGKHKFYKIA